MMRVLLFFLRPILRRVARQTPAPAGRPPDFAPAPAIFAGTPSTFAPAPGILAERPGESAPSPAIFGEEPASVGSQQAIFEETPASVGSQQAIFEETPGSVAPAQSSSGGPSSDFAEGPGQSGPAPAIQTDAPSESAGDAGPLAAAFALAASLSVVLGRIRTQCRPVSLDEAQRKRLGGMIFIGAQRFVRAAAFAVERCPELAPRRGVSRASLILGQARANFWFGLQAQLQRWAQLAADSHLAEQTAVIRDAMDIVRKHRLASAAAEMAAARPGDAPPIDENEAPRILRQRFALAEALAILDRRQRARRRHQREAAQGQNGRRGAQKS